jgi:chitinase
LNLPFFIADGCVERAIVSAGGPKISCQGQGLDVRKRFKETRAQVTASPSRPSISDEERRVFESFYGNATAYHQYMTMDWRVWSTKQSSSSTVSVK